MKYLLTSFHNFLTLTLFSAAIGLVIQSSAYSQNKFTFEDVLKFEDIKTPVISANGEWVAFGVWPEIGDGRVSVKRVDGSREFSIERGEQPQLTNNGNWAGALVLPPYIESENAGKDAPKPQLSLLNTSSGETELLEEVRSFSFSIDGSWVLVRHHREEEVSENDHTNSHLGTPVSLIRLGSDEKYQIPFVNDAVIDSTSSYFIYATVDTAGIDNGLYAIYLRQNQREPKKISGSEHAYYSNLTWDHGRSRIAMTAARLDSANKYRPFDASIVTWNLEEEEPETLLIPDDVMDGYRLRSNNSLSWSYDGERLFYGVMDADMVELDEREETSDSLTTDNLYQLDRILNDIEGKVWHWNDPQIKTHEKQTWSSRKNHLYTAVYHLADGKPVQLATKQLPVVQRVHHSGKTIGWSDLPYQKLRTWDGTYRDYYLIDLESGESEQFIEMQRFGASVSPGGRFAAWFDGNYWHLKHTDTGITRNLTGGITTPFFDEDNDRPQPSGSYGIAGWTEDDESVLIYDKYDIWQFNTLSGHTINITGNRGRDEQRVFRIRDINPEKETFERNERLLLTMYHDWYKNYGFYEARTGSSGVTQIMEDEKRFNIVAVAEDDGSILFTQESYSEYPNLWVTGDRRFRNLQKVSDLHDDLTEKFAWGHAELVDWYNLDGKVVQGILIYPGDYDPERRYPVFIYYYERFSQRLYDFNKPVTNHRPNLAQYASDGYAVFLPDIWFDVPVPGYSATKNLVPGVHKLIEMGVADPDAIGLHGHSWSGYLTAQVVTETDIFAAAVAGAPVGNMTSAYGGIRWGTGLARQFQYEQTQSRLGVSMWENLAPYIENSPVFFADRINTPLMIQHGDADEAVPWYQSIELYLALRRNGKESVFLHYYDEPHHLRKLANRLDYAIKMKEYMDHYLKGTPAPAWITEGVPYIGQ
jgi:dipeptidyl aminopeptidase/acylaminoacyl peptidase